MSPLTRLTTLALAALLVPSCVGYRLGGAKPTALAGVKSIAVPMFANHTLEPRVEVLATNSTVSALAADGTYRIAASGQADAILEASVERIDYAQIRTFRLDTQRPSELENSVAIKWTLKDAADPTKTLDHGTAYGTSRLFLDPTAQTARINALPDAIQEAARSIASRLGDGF